MIIEGKVGSGYLSDIAIDDMSFGTMACEAFPARAKVAVTVPTKPTTTHIPTTKGNLIQCSLIADYLLFILIKGFH